MLHVPCGEQDKRPGDRWGIQIRRVSADWKKLCRIVDHYNVSGKEGSDASFRCKMALPKPHARYWVKHAEYEKTVRNLREAQKDGCASVPTVQAAS